ncbi:hypothetical protein [Streptomyces sp. NPDC059874]|uniref:hypothetical protein n=1 Tax=Streptomyces sp. NPDC059874 TaxID=3346983 RepID=UPI003662E110
MSSTAPDVRVVVAVDPERFTDAVKALREAGLVLDAEYPDIGSLTGRVAEDRLQGLEGIDGVEAVERDRTYELRPPDSPLQ